MKQIEMSLEKPGKGKSISDHSDTQQIELPTEKEANTIMEIDIFSFLNALRESGEINMWGASTYLEQEFSIEHKEAKLWLYKWMKSFKGTE